MKSIRGTRSLLLLAGVAILTGCGSNNNESEEEIDDTIAFESISKSASFILVNSAEDFDRPSDIVFADSVSLVMPKSLCGQDITALRDSIMACAFDTIGEDIHAVSDAFLNNCAAGFGYETKPSNLSISATLHEGFSIVSGNIVALTPDILTYRISRSTYLPGTAHGMTDNQYISYIIPKAKILTITDLFTPEGIEALPKVIQQQADELSSAIGPTEIESLPAGNNFYISNDGQIIFAYQPYEVASYAQGEIQVPFYPYELVQYMTTYAINRFRLADLSN
jgi:hypothetical protein